MLFLICLLVLFILSRRTALDNGTVLYCILARRQRKKEALAILPKALNVVCSPPEHIMLARTKVSWCFKNVSAPLSYRVCVRVFRCLFQMNDI